VIERYKDHIVFYVYRKSDVYRLIGRLIYDSAALAPIRRQFWPEVKINGQSLGESFSNEEELLRRIGSVQEQR
jgi:hypothetical protein